MTLTVDVWLRGTNVASTQSIGDVPREPGAWLDEDVRLVLEGMLRAMHRARHVPAQPGASAGVRAAGDMDANDEPAISLRGLSWIVNPYAEGGVVIAIEITMGAAIAGPFDIEQGALEAMIARVIERRPSASVH